MEFRPLESSKDRLACYEQLLKATFPPNPKFSYKGLHWLYAENPEGHAVGYDAFDGDRLAAHYACIPTRVRLEGKTVKGLLSLNTATHPDYRGQKLLEQLVHKTYESAAELGYDHVQGAGNAISTPLFIRKFGFKHIRQLDAKIGIGGLGVDLEAAHKDAAYVQDWTQKSINWRMKNPSNPVTARAFSGGVGFYAKSFSRIVPAYAEIGAKSELGSIQMGGMQSPLRLHIGLFPKASGTPTGYFDIPQRFRPSPLNFLFLPLLGSTTRSIDPDGVIFSFLDFDAY